MNKPVSPGTCFKRSGGTVTLKQVTSLIDDRHVVFFEV